MRRIEALVKQIRRTTENQAQSVDNISDLEIMQWINDAQEDIQAAILDSHPDTFTEEESQDSVRGQAIYTLPKYVFSKHRVVNVDYLHNTSSPARYYPLKKIGFKERRDVEGRPYGYVLRDTEFILSPIPDISNTGSIRINYQERLPTLYIEIAKVNTATISSGSLTALTLTGELSNISDIMAEDQFLTAVDECGVIKTKEIKYDYDTPLTGSTVNLNGGSHTMQSGETIDPGDSIVLGERATHISKLPHICEKYLICYGEWRAFKRDSSVDATEKNQERMEMRGQIVQTFADPTGDIDEIPVSELDYMFEEGLHGY